MAINLRRLFRPNISLANNILFKSNFVNVGLRSMYTDRDLGITSYENTRFIFRNQFSSIEDTFRSKMKELCEQEDGIIYTEDLKAMLHLVQDTDEDINLLLKMLERYNTVKQEQRFGSYVFGPVVMRMFYYLNQPEHALTIIENDTLSQNFNYRSSFRTLLCLLFKNNMYREMRSVYDKYLNIKGLDFIGRNSILIYAACLKENTPESLEYAIDCWKKEYEIIKPAMRSSAMVACLAIKNNAAETALEILSLIEKDKTISIRSLKILAYINLKRYLQIIPLLKFTFEQCDSVQSKGFFADVIYHLEEKVKVDNISEKEDLLKLIDMFKASNYLETDKTLEEFLFQPLIIMHRTDAFRKELKYKNRNYSRHDRVGLKSYL